MTEHDPQSLVGFLKAEWESAKQQRKGYESRWAEDIGLYMGIYTPDELARMDNDRSHAFMRYVKRKTDAIVSKLMDLLFPGTGKNWTLQATPEVDLPDEYLDVMLTGLGLPPAVTAEEKRDLIKAEFERRVELMEKEFEDLLVEGQETNGRTRVYREAIRQMIVNGCLLGTGVFKGPLTNLVQKKTWLPGENGWELTVVSERFEPFVEAVPTWDWYPERTDVALKDLRYCYQRHKMQRHELLQLHEENGFDTTAIRDWIREHPDGDAEKETHEQALRTLDENDHSQEYKYRFEVLERWGYISAKKLAGHVDEYDGDLEEDVPACLWMLGDRVIKAEISPIEGLVIPYYVWTYNASPTSLYGEGVPRLLLHPQQALNGAFRMLLDNNAIAAGPLVGINEQVVSEQTDTKKIKAWDVLLFDNIEDMKAALMFWAMPNHSNELMAVISMLREWADELSLPAHQMGSTRVRGAGETAKGLSMLMTEAGLDMGEQVKRYDDNVTVPFFTNLYAFEMQFGERDEIKGDARVKALGASELMAREVRMEKLFNSVTITDNERFRGMMDDYNLLLKIHRALDLGDDLIKPREEYEKWVAEQAQSQEQQITTRQAEAEVAEKEAKTEKTSAETQKVLAEVQKLIAELESMALNLGAKSVEAEHAGHQESEIGSPGELEVAPGEQRAPAYA